MPSPSVDADLPIRPEVLASPSGGGIETTYDGHHITSQALYSTTPTPQGSTDNLFGSELRVIAVMGPTGTGRSTFIKVATGADNVRVGDGLTSCTQACEAILCRNPLQEHDVILVDTPGFDDTYRSDVEILKEIAFWLQKTYKVGVKLSGILYFHRITDSRMNTSLTRSLKMFENLCGEDALSNVILVTTQWDQLKGDIDFGLQNEEELRRNDWRPFLERGSQMLRFENTKSSAWHIINALPIAPTALKIQEEMVDRNETLSKTSAVEPLLLWLRRTSQVLKGFISRLDDTTEANHAADRDDSENGDPVQRLKATRAAAKENLTRIECEESQLSCPTPGPNSTLSLNELFGDAVKPLLYRSLRPLVRKLIAKSSREIDRLVANLNREDAQAIADLLSTVLSQEEGLLVTDEGNRILVMLCKLATSTQVYPQRYILKDVQCDPRPIAGGAFADVYKGQHENRVVCVKVARNYGLGDETLNAYIKKLMLWAHLSHRNILPFYGVHLVGTSICPVSPWMNSGTLREYAKKLPQKPRMPLVFGVAGGMAYLHQLNVIHSDLKGENVLVSNEGRALITDFGVSHIATATSLQGPTSSLVGCTVRFSAPESLERGEYIRPTKESDVWSFGCLCYEVLSRRMPFHQYLMDPQVIRALSEGEIPQRPRPGQDNEDEIDDLTWALMESCWKLKPEDRPTFQDIHNQFAEMSIRDDRFEGPASSGSDPTFLGPKKEEPNKIDFERATIILRKLASHEATAGKPNGD